MYDHYSEADLILLSHQEGYWAGILKPYYNTLEISESGNLTNQSTSRLRRVSADTYFSRVVLYNIEKTTNILQGPHEYWIGSVHTYNECVLAHMNSDMFLQMYGI